MYKTSLYFGSEWYHFTVLLPSYRITRYYCTVLHAIVPHHMLLLYRFTVYYCTVHMLLLYRFTCYRCCAAVHATLVPLHMLRLLYRFTCYCYAALHATITVPLYVILIKFYSLTCLYCAALHVLALVEHGRFVIRARPNFLR